MFGKSNQDPDLELFTLFDSKIGRYRSPLMAENRHEMMRNVELFCRNSQNHTDPLFVNAEDFQIFKIGEYSKKTGEILAQKPEHIANVYEIKAMVLRSLKETMGIAPT